jgi:superfamily II DNA or RNA helicase
MAAFGGVLVQSTMKRAGSPPRMLVQDSLKRFKVVPPAPPGARLRGRLTFECAPEDAQELTARLTLQPKASAASRDLPDPLPMAFYDPAARLMSVPRMWALDNYEPASILAADERTLGQPLRPEAVASSRITLTKDPPQVAAMEATLAQLRGPLGAGQLVLPCGMGKTICGTHAILALGRKALVLVTDRGLKKQWLKRFETYTPGLRVGSIQGKKAEFEDSDVCIGMVQSFFNPNKYPAALFEAFGTIVVDESHLMAAREMSKVVPMFAARYLLALSATPERDDGCTDALHWMFGPIAFRCARAWQRVNVEVVHYGPQLESITYRDGTLAWDKMIKLLYRNPHRNAFIVQRTLQAVDGGFKPMLLTESREHIEALHAHLLAARPGLSVGVYHGDLDDAQRDAFLGSVFDVVIAILKMGKQGLDKPECKLLICATPVKAKYEQAVGRVLRAYPGGHIPTIVDIIDRHGVFQGMARVRAKLYKQENYSVSHSDHDHDHDHGGAGSLAAATAATAATAGAAAAAGVSGVAATAVAGVSGVAGGAAAGAAAAAAAAE